MEYFKIRHNFRHYSMPEFLAPPIDERPQPIPLSPFQPASQQSSMGAFDPAVLPFEMFELIVSHMDLKSICQFQASSTTAYRVIRGLAAYQRVMKHAYVALRAMVKYQALENLSLDTIDNALCCDKCADCDNYGPYLSLLTGKRICWEDMVLNPSHWVLPLGPSEWEAQWLFGLSKSRISNLATLRAKESGASPGSGKVLVNLGAAKRRGTFVHGGEWNMLIYVAGKANRVSRNREAKQVIVRNTLSNEKSVTDAIWLYQQPEFKSTRCPNSVVIDRIYVNQYEIYTQLAHIQFPSLSSKERLSYGYRCCGCYFKSGQRWVESGYSFVNKMSYRRQHTLSEKDFLVHIKTCPGFGELSKLRCQIVAYKDMVNRAVRLPPAVVKQVEDAEVGWVYEKYHQENITLQQAWAGIAMVG